MGSFQVSGYSSQGFSGLPRVERARFGYMKGQTGIRIRRSASQASGTP